MAILYPASLANLVVEVGTRHCHQTLLNWMGKSGLNMGVEMNRTSVISMSGLVIKLLMYCSIPAWYISYMIWSLMEWDPEIIFFHFLLSSYFKIKKLIMKILHIISRVIEIVFICPVFIKWMKFNSLAPSRFEWNFRQIIFRLIVEIGEVSLVVLPPD